MGEVPGPVVRQMAVSMQRVCQSAAVCKVVVMQRPLQGFQLLRYVGIRPSVAYVIADMKSRLHC